MTTKSPVLQVSGIDIDVDRKDIKNLYIGVYPPLGRVRVSAPEDFDDEAIQRAVLSRLVWIRKRQANIRGQARQSRREMVDGESHFAWGRRYRLRVAEDGARRRVDLKADDWLELHVPAGADRDARERRLAAWYREELRREIPPLIERWAPIIGVESPSWGIRRMKTKWGTCQPEKKKIWLNLELAKKPHSCLEYIVVHELIHLLERNHNDRFYAFQDRFLPSWRTQRALLNSQPLADEDWGESAA